jgi:hypothetical protein
MRKCYNYERASVLEVTLADTTKNVNKVIKSKCDFYDYRNNRYVLHYNFFSDILSNTLMKCRVSSLITFVNKFQYRLRKS